jgi:hypothetical protein
MPSISVWVARAIRDGFVVWQRKAACGGVNATE